MTNKNTVPEIWFLNTELEGERAGGFRQERWCRVFLDSGFRIRIFNLRGAFRRTEFECGTVDAFDAFRRRCRANAPAVASLREGVGSRLGRTIKHYLLIDLYLPNVVGLFLRVLHLLRQHPAPVLIMASSPPFSIALVGALLKWKYPKKLWLTIDMRDAWALHNALGGFKWLRRFIERKVLRRADHIITVSRWLANEFGQAQGIVVKVMYNVATHYFGITTEQPKINWAGISNDIDTGRIKIIYTGSTPRGHYDIATFVGAVALLRAERADLADRVQFIFVGACSEVAREVTAQAIHPKDIVFVGHLPHQLVRSVQAAADLLLFFAHFGEGNKGVVSTKLFEYICLGQPLLPISLHAGSDVDQLLQRFCTSSICVHGVADMAAVFTEVATSGVSSMPRLKQPDRTAELLDDYVRYAQEQRAAYSTYFSASGRALRGQIEPGISPMGCVAVCLAAYNGVRWIDEQLNSILGQTDVALTVFVSVDRSDDGTEALVDHRASTDPRLVVLPHGERYGSAAQNFFRLLRDVDFTPFSHVCFADQDDIWHINKLSHAIAVMQHQCADAVSTNVTAFWPDGRELLIRKDQAVGRWNHLFESAGPGCTYVFTAIIARELGAALRALPQSSIQAIALHDWLVFAWVRAHGGSWWIDATSTVWYRQHASNEFGANQGVAAAMSRWQRLTGGWYRDQVLAIATFVGQCRSEPIQCLQRLNVADRLALLTFVPQLRRRWRDRFFLAVAFLLMQN